MTTADDVTVADMVEVLATATGDDALRRAGIGAATQLEGDLYLDSLDLVTVGALLAERYGPGLDLPGYLAGLDIDDIIGLTVGAVTDYVNRCRR